MSKFEIEYSCGHTGVKQLYGKHKDRMSKAEWLAKGVCDVCQQERVAKQIAKQIQEMRLPALTGTQKQISWAKRIRYEAIERLQAILASSHTPLAESLVEAVCAESSAAWWIDNNNQNSTTLLSRTNIFLSIELFMRAYLHDVANEEFLDEIIKSILQAINERNVVCTFADVRQNGLSESIGKCLQLDKTKLTALKLIQPTADSQHN
ncbi:MAG: hypothetical protein WCD70_07425 [Alphaproteobacteria bacterium]